MHTSIHSGRTENHPASPHAMVYGYFALSSEIGLFCLRRRQSKLRKLDASVEASGPHDLAVRFSAARQEHIRVHRISSRVRDDRDTPLMWDETARFIEVIWGNREREYFSLWDSTAAITPNLARRAPVFSATLPFLIAKTLPSQTRKREPRLPFCLNRCDPFVVGLCGGVVMIQAGEHHVHHVLGVDVTRE